MQRNMKLLQSNIFDLQYNFTWWNQSHPTLELHCHCSPVAPVLCLILLSIPMRTPPPQICCSLLLSLCFLFVVVVAESLLCPFNFRWHLLPYLQPQYVCFSNASTSRWTTIISCHIKSQDTTGSENSDRLGVLTFRFNSVLKERHYWIWKPTFIK